MKLFKKIILFVVVLIIILTVGWLLFKRPDNNRDNVNLDNSKFACNEVAPKYVGLTESQAIAQTKQGKRPYRIVTKDGKGGPITEDYSPNRLNFDVKKDKITKAECY